MLKHKLKLKLARRLRTSQEIRDRISPFNTPAWHSHCKAQQPKKKKKIVKQLPIEPKKVEPQMIAPPITYSNIPKKVSWFKKIFNAKINRKNNRDRSE